MTYLPLPEILILKKSDVHGMGLFAKSKILKDTSLGMSHINIDGKIIRTPLGGFYNHSETPNCIKYEKDNRFYLKTISDIEEGEELTVKYTLYNIE
jgi:SET domain-containing protein